MSSSLSKENFQILRCHLIQTFGVFFILIKVLISILIDSGTECFIKLTQELLLGNSQSMQSNVSLCHSHSGTCSNLPPISTRWSLQYFLTCNDQMGSLIIFLFYLAQRNFPLDLELCCTTFTLQNGIQGEKFIDRTVPLSGSEHFLDPKFIFPSFYFKLSAECFWEQNSRQFACKIQPGTNSNTSIVLFLRETD